ncbi:MAG: glycerol-3-phosphate responsive antiterminator [Firmicutes bacterium]|nr:glycerol-3-phosphate responsive antiterminator [Bacillota bacterium]
MQTLAQHFRQAPIIAGLREAAEVEAAIAKGVQTVFFLGGSIFKLRDLVSRAADDGLLTFAHVDLTTGIGRDLDGMRFLSEEVGLDGIVTTRSHLIRYAKECQLLTIQRVFLLDSESLRTGIQVIRNSQPDAVEVLPALVVPYWTDVLAKEVQVPIIAGGLIRDQQDIDMVLGGPVVAVSTSRKELWQRPGQLDTRDGM